MKSVNEIITYLDNELEDANKNYNYWESRNPSEAMKYRIAANTLENILDDITLQNKSSSDEEKKRLAFEIHRLEKQYENNKFKRMIATIVCFIIVFAILFLFTQEIKGIKEILICIVSSTVCGFLYFYLNILIFIPLFNKSQKENVHLEKLKDKYNSLY